MEKIVYQPSMGFGVPTKRVFPWEDMLEQYARELGDCPSIGKTQWYKELAGRLYSGSPDAFDMMEAVVKSNDPHFGIKILGKFFTLDSMPAPDTLPRAMRKVREKLIDSGVLQINHQSNNGDTFSSLLQSAEGEAGQYNSHLEVRFGQRLKQRFRQFNWEENKLVEVGSEKVRPDFLCEILALSIEIDSWEFHKDRLPFMKDRRKSRLMQLAGYYHLQFSGGELSIPGGMTTALNEIETFISDRKLA